MARRKPPSDFGEATAFMLFVLATIFLVGMFTALHLMQLYA